MKRSLLGVTLTVSLLTSLGCEPGADPNHGGPDSAGSPGATLWSKSFGGSLEDSGSAIAVDSRDNIFLTGSFQSQIDLGSGPLSAAQGREIFLAKFSAAGEPLWSKRFGDSHALGVTAIATDADGNVIIAGYVLGPVDFGGGALAGGAAGNQDAFVAKFNALGQHVFSKRVGDSSLQVAASVTTDRLGNVLLCGQFSGTADFAGGNPLTAKGQRDGFLVKYAPDGTHLWSKALGNSSLEAAYAVKTNSQNRIWVAGHFESTTNIGFLDFKSLDPSGDLFLGLYDATGEHVFSTAFHGDGIESIQGLAIDSQDRVVLAGSFTGTLNFGGDPLKSASLLESDVFFAQLTANGQHLVSKRFGGLGTDAATDVAIDAGGNIVLVGSFSQNIGFGDTPLSSRGSTSQYVLRLDESGRTLWAKGYGGSGAAAANAVAIDSTGSAIVSGYYSESIDYGKGPHIAIGSSDIPLFKLAP